MLISETCDGVLFIHRWLEYEASDSIMCGAHSLSTIKRRFQQKRHSQPNGRTILTASNSILLLHIIKNGLQI